MIFDTTFVIDLMNRNEDALIKLSEIIKKGDIPIITSLTIFELFSGLVRSKRPIEEKHKIMEILEGQIIVSLDKESAEKSGEIDGTLIKEGETIGPIDSMIAGIALVKKERILTRNVKDFSRIKELQVETY